jgi:hypothetical protein
MMILEMPSMDAALRASIQAAASAEIASNTASNLPDPAMIPVPVASLITKPKLLVAVPSRKHHRN